MIPPTNIHCHARLKRTMRYLVDKRTSIWKFDPSASETRASELTATSDSDREVVRKQEKTEFLGEYHEDTDIILDTASSAAKANAERPGCGRMKHIRVKYRYLQDAITNHAESVRK